MLTEISLNDFNRTKENIDEFYRVRKEIFIDRLKWDLPIHEGKEIDQFDHSDCHYLLSSHHEKIIGGARLTSSLYPNLTFDYFENYLPFLTPIERTSDLLEVSRFGLKTMPSYTSSSILKTTTLELMKGIFKFSLDHNYKKIIAVTERRIARILKFLDLSIHPVSETKQYGEVHVFIGTIDITSEKYEQLKSQYSKHYNSKAT